MRNRIRVLVVDDSALMRRMIPQVLQGDPAIEVVGTAMDGAFALRKIEELRPDVVTLDLQMPRMDGVETLRVIMRQHHVPVIVVSAYSTQGAKATLKALALGAFDFVPKPRHAASGHLEEIATELTLKIKVAAASGPPKMIFTVPSAKQKRSGKLEARCRPTRVVAIGVSTGGPNAIQYLLSQLPEDFPGCILLVQHMPAGFTEMFAQRLDECTPLEVKEARSGDLLLAGRVIICPGNQHLKVRRLPQGDIVVLSDHPPVNGHRPSADVLFHSVAHEFGQQVVGVLMTGMGDDGAAGLGAIQKAGGVTLAQSPETCVVDSMPRSALERGYASRVVPLSGLASVLLAQCMGERPSVAEETFQAVPEVID